MLVVPFVAGVILRLQAGAGAPPFSWTLVAFWMLGYFAFNAASLWLKAHPARRRPLLAPLGTYAAASTVLGVATLLLAGPGILGWAPAYLVLLAPALVLAARRHERATLGGGLTTAAASLMALVVVCPDPATVLAWASPAPQAARLAGLLFAYFFGTVLYVKTNIRERGSSAFYAASVGWHTLATLATALPLPGGPAPAWAVLFALATLRAAWVPRHTPPLSPARIGLVEVAFCVAILLIVAVA